MMTANTKMTLSLLTALLIVGLARSGEGTPVLWTVNGHYYDALSYPGGITWDTAKVVAENSTYLGMTGHLATVTSLEENAFILNSLGGPVALNAFLPRWFPAHGQS